MALFKYKRLVDQVRKDILSSVYAPGQQIPIEDDLMERFVLSRNMVRQGVKILVEEGYLVKIQGSGTFVVEKLPAEKQRENDGRRRIGIVMNQINTYIFPSLLMGISDCLFENDYSTVIRHTFNRIAREEQVLSELLNANLQGLIVEPTRSALPRVNHDLYRKIEATMPCVLMHAVIPGFRFPSVTVADAAGFELLVDHLAARGHKNIAAFCKFDEQTGIQRFLGYAAGLRKHNLRLDESRVLWYADEDVERFFSNANAPRILSAIKGCTAVMCHNDDIAGRFQVLLHKHGIAVPDALSIVGFDDSAKGGAVSPVTTIIHPKDGLGRALGSAILELVSNPGADVSRCFAPELVDWGTVRDLTEISKKE